MLVRFAIPGSIILFALIYGWIWRWDVSAWPTGTGFLVIDRWYGTVAVCGDQTCQVRFTPPLPKNNP